MVKTGLNNLKIDKLKIDKLEVDKMEVEIDPTYTNHKD